jgi:hypothetical protein
MKKGKSILIFALSGILFYSCQSSKRVQREMQNFRSELDYELTTPEYLGEIEKTVYLNPIDNSNMQYYTVVTDKSVLVLPFILYNYWHKKFYTTLGEGSLTQPYRYFLRDALLAECNRSSCFNLEDGDAVTIPKSAYTLDVKIIHNKTQSGIKETNSFLFIPSYDMTFSFIHAGYQVLPVSSELEIAVRLLQGNTCLFEKTYSAKQEQKVRDGTWDNSLAAENGCVENMTFCLATATKGIIEDISRSIHLILLVK